MASANTCMRPVVRGGGVGRRRVAVRTKRRFKIVAATEAGGGVKSIIDETKTFAVCVQTIVTSRVCTQPRRRRAYTMSCRNQIHRYVYNNYGRCAKNTASRAGSGCLARRKS